MAATVRDVAALAGVSAMTVSNVLNGHANRTTASTAAKVRAAMQELGYVPNASARALSRQSSGLVALLLPSDPSDAPHLLSVHDSVLLREIERQVSLSGKHLLLHAPSDLVGAVDEVLRTWNVDGAIVFGAFAGEVDELLERTQAPLVLVDNYSRSSKAVIVGIDDAAGGEAAGTELCALGHQRVAFVGPRTDVDGVTSRRLAGFRSALEVRGVELAEDLIIVCDSTFEEGLRVADVVAQHHRAPTAVFATSDLIAAGIQTGLTRRGIGVPDQISVIGFDDLPIARMMTPELTTVRQDISAKAARAVERLMTSISAPSPERSVEQLPVELIRRGSTAPPAR